MTFNEWWAGQNLPEDTKAVALAAWYACQLYGERIVQPVGVHSHIGTAEAHGHQLDAIGSLLGIIREHDSHGVETDHSYRERIQQEQCQKIPRRCCDHSWSMIHDHVHTQECERCGVRR